MLKTCLAIAVWLAPACAGAAGPLRRPAAGKAAPVPVSTAAPAAVRVTPEPVIEVSRAKLRAMARSGLKVKSAREWADFMKTRAADLSARRRLTLSGGAGMMTSEEIDAWKNFPAEAVTPVYFPCSSGACDGQGIKGAGFYRAYYQDGFVLQLDGSGEVLDLYYQAGTVRKKK